MNTRMRVKIGFLAILSVLFAPGVYAADACVQVCQQRNRAEVRACDYPKKEPEAHRDCLATARSNFDACMQACGK